MIRLLEKPPVQNLGVVEGGVIDRWNAKRLDAPKRAS
jgi:hypothetical protein